MTRDDRSELMEGGAGPGDIARGDRDLDLRDEEPAACPPIPGLGDLGVDGRGGRLDLALGQPDEGKGRMWRVAPGMGLAEGRLGTFEIALEAANLADRVVAVRLDGG